MMLLFTILEDLKSIIKKNVNINKRKLSYIYIVIIFKICPCFKRIAQFFIFIIFHNTIMSSIENNLLNSTSFMILLTFDIKDKL